MKHSRSATHFVLIVILFVVSRLCRNILKVDVFQITSQEEFCDSNLNWFYFVKVVLSRIVS